MAALNEASLKEKLRDDPVGVYLIFICNQIACAIRFSVYGNFLCG